MGTADVILKDSVVVGIGGAGTKIASLVASSIKCSCVLISNDKRDLVSDSNEYTSIFVDSQGWMNPSSYRLRSLAQIKLKEITEAISGFSSVIVFANLAGKAGTAIAPLVCKEAREFATVLSVAIMPFRFEKERIFQSGVALQRLRDFSHATIIIDNDAFLENNPEFSSQDCYEITNRALVEVVSLVCTGNRIQSETHLLATSKDCISVEHSIRDSISMLYGDISNPNDVKRTVLYVVGAENAPLGSLNNIFNAVGSIFGSDGRHEGKADVTMSLSSSPVSNGGTRVHLLASAPQKTRFDRYDPLSEIIPKESRLDWDELECCLDTSIDNLVSME